MFCSKCGEKLDESVSFCPKCGAKIVNGASNGNQSIEQSSVNQVSIQKNTKPITVLSIMGFVFFLLGIIVFFGIKDYDLSFGFCLIYFAFAFTYAIIALVLANKFKFKATKVMAIIGLVWYTIGGFAFFAMMGNNDGLEPIMIYLLYTLAFSIVSFVQSKEKNIS